MIQPHRVPDDLDRIPVALVPRRNRHNDQSFQPPHKVNNLVGAAPALTPPCPSKLGPVGHPSQGVLSLSGLLADAGLKLAINASLQVPDVGPEVIGGPPVDELAVVLSGSRCRIRA